LNIDLGSPIIDIAVALSFIFFLLSVIVSAVTEFGAGVSRLRGRTLKKGLEGMLGDADVVKGVLKHPLVRTHLRKSEKAVDSHKERTPSYISAANFAQAFRSVANSSEILAADLEKQLAGLGIDPEKVRKSDLKKVEKWFDDSMERVGGWYKRTSQIIAIVVAVVVAVSLNANAIRIAERLDQEPATRAAVLTAAEKAIRKEPKMTAAERKEHPAAVVEIERAGKHFAKATKEVEALNLPLFWTKANALHSIPWWKTALGLLITAIAISFGAPFWFDALNKLANLRMAGKKPEETKPAPA
jgi:hypothetical protein